MTSKAPHEQDMTRKPLKLSLACCYYFRGYLYITVSAQALPDSFPTISVFGSTDSYCAWSSSATTLLMKPKIPREVTKWALNTLLTMLPLMNSHQSLNQNVWQKMLQALVPAAYSRCAIFHLTVSCKIVLCRDAQAHTHAPHAPRVTNYPFHKLVSVYSAIKVPVNHTKQKPQS